LADEPLISSELQGLVNVEFGPVQYDIEKWWLKKFTESIGDPNPRWQVEIPPTFYTALTVDALFEKVFAAKAPVNRLLNGKNELEYYLPVKLGDTVTVTGKLADLRGRGKMIFMTMEFVYKNQRAETVARLKYNLVRY
jgi:hypothetical protein